MYPTLRMPGAGARDARLPPRPAFRQLSSILLPSSVLLWGIGIATTNAAAPGPYGLITSLSPAFWLGLLLLVISAGIDFSQSRLSEIRLCLHAVVLVVMLYGTAPLLYSEGRYSWLYKTIGVVQYVNAHGSLDGSIDIYQHWSGFFALAGWFDKVAGVGSPLGYAKWTQLVFELAAIPLLNTIYRALSLRPWHRWLAVMLYSASNWIGQDYFSPQGLSTLISFGIMAIIARWMFVVTPRRGQRDEWSPAHTRRALPFIGTVLFLFFVLTVSHELTPYILTIQIATLAICSLARPRWVALAVAAITIAYLVPNFTYVNTHYGLTASIGSFFGNVHPPRSSGPALPLPESTRIVNYCADALCLGIWLLALVGAWRHRKARRIVLALLLLTFSPVLVLFGGAYGNEGILRVYLFSLPWAAALASCSLAPVRPRNDKDSRSPFRVVIPLALAITLFFPAFYGGDSFEVMTSDEVNTLVSFQETAKPGVVLAALSNFPFSDTEHYNEFPIGAVYGSYGVALAKPASTDPATYLARSVMDDLGTTQVAYVVITPSMVAYNKFSAVTAPENITDLASSLAKSQYWQVVVNHDGILIYRLTAINGEIPPGPHAKAVVVGVP